MTHTPSPTAQRDLARTYQTLHAATDSAANDTLTALLDSVAALTATTVREHFGPRRHEWDDLLADAHVSLIGAAHTYNPDGKPTWAQIAGGAVRNAMLKAAVTYQAQGGTATGVPGSQRSSPRCARRCRTVRRRCWTTCSRTSRLRCSNSRTGSGAPGS